MTEINNYSPSLLVNQANYNDIKGKVTCVICRNIPIDPVKCINCSNVYCRNCIGEKHCINCKKETLVEPFKETTDLINGLMFKCKFDCGEEFSYSDIEKHYQMETDKKEYNDLLNQYIKLIRLVEAESFTKESNFKGKKINNHPHGLVWLTTDKVDWKCQRCQHIFNKGTPCYYCTLCDYEICDKCIS